MKKPNALLRHCDIQSGVHCPAEPKVATLKNLLIHEFLNSCQFPASDALVQKKSPTWESGVATAKWHPGPRQPLLHDNWCLKMSQRQDQ